MNRRIISTTVAVIIIAFFVLTSLFAAGMSFTDVNGSDWFYEDVKNAVDMGLVNGKTATIYAPQDKLTYAETIKLAACMHQKHTDGKITLTNGNPWYMSYVNYCKNNNIINRDYDWGKNTSRAEYMDIFSRALPASALSAINSVSDNAIPDVPSTHKYAKQIYMLYRAGIVQGMDVARNCKPDTNITRAEVAAILTRMMDKTKRISFTLGSEKPDPTKPDPAKPQELKIEEQPKDVYAKRGEKVKFSIKAKGEGLTYQWQVYDGLKFMNLVDGAEVQGAQTSEIELTIPKAAVSAISGRCLVKDKNNKELISETAKALIKPEIVKQPQNTTVIAGKVATLEVEAVGDDLSYQWFYRKDGESNLSELENNNVHKGAKTNKLDVTVIDALVLPEKVYYKCVISNKNGDQVDTQEVCLRKSPAPYISRIKFVTGLNPAMAEFFAEEAEKEGYTIIRKNLNEGANGNIIYLAYRTSENIKDAITDLFVEASDHEENVTGSVLKNHNGTGFFEQIHTDLNENTPMHSYLYLYYTNDKGYDFGGGTTLGSESRSELYGLDIEVQDSPLGGYIGGKVVQFYNTTSYANLNEGAGGKYIYLIMKKLPRF